MTDGATRSAQLLRLARRVTARRDLDDVLGEVFRGLRELVTFGGGSIQLLDDEGWIQMAAADPAAPEHVMSQRIPLGSSVGGRVILTELPVYLPDIADTARSAGRRVSSGVRSYFAVPLVADGRAIGLLQVDSPTPDAWAEDERGLFVAVAPMVAAAIQNARAHVVANDARTRAEASEAAASEAQRLVALARRLAANGTRAELDDCLSRLDAALAQVVSNSGVGLPQPRSG